MFPRKRRISFLPGMEAVAGAAIPIRISNSITLSRIPVEAVMSLPTFNCFVKRVTGANPTAALANSTIKQWDGDVVRDRRSIPLRTNRCNAGAGPNKEADAN